MPFRPTCPHWSWRWAEDGMSCAWVRSESILGALQLGRPATFQTRPCALDRDEAQTAVTVTRAAMDLAVQLGAGAVIVSLGSVGERGDGGERLWQALLGKLRRGVLLYDDSAAQELRGLRAALAGRHLDAALRSVEQMLRRLASRPAPAPAQPTRGLELPAAYELSALRSTFSGAPLSTLLDLPAAHFCSTLRLLPLGETILSFAGGAGTMPAAAPPILAGQPGGCLWPDRRSLARPRRSAAGPRGPPSRWTASDFLCRGTSLVSAMHAASRRLARCEAGRTDLALVAVGRAIGANRGHRRADRDRPAALVGSSADSFAATVERAVQRAAIDAQDLGGALLVATFLLQDQRDVALL